MSYKITIVIPSFNVEYYIERCFLSIINQSIGFENLEIIVVDDVSTDNTRFIIEKYAERYDNIKFNFLKENSGAAGKPRNVGLEMASADYVMFLDPDDFLTNNACEILYNKITSENVDIVAGRLSYKEVSGEFVPFPGMWIDTFTDPSKDFKLRQLEIKKLLREYNREIKLNSVDDCELIIKTYGLACKIFRLKFIKDNDITFPINIPAQDSVFLYNSILNASGIIFIDDIIYGYEHERQDKGNKSLTHQVNVARNNDRLMAYKLMLDISRDNDKEYSFVNYLLSTKLRFYINEFIVKSTISKEEIKKSIEGYHFLFNLVYESDFKIQNNFVPFFEKIYNGEIDDAIDYIVTQRPKD